MPVKPDTLYAGKAGIENLLNTGAENGTHWIPAEVDVSIRKGWFYHAEEDTLVKTPEQLFDIYLTSVGRGSTLLLNIPPDKRGLVHTLDSSSLMGFRALLDSAFKTNIVSGKPVQVSSFRGKDEKYGASNLVDNDAETYWATDDAVTTGSIEIDLGETKPLNFILLQEYIPLGQRIKAFTVEVRNNNTWQQIAEGTTIGYKRILKLNGVNSDAIRIIITDSKASPVISNIAVY